MVDWLLVACDCFAFAICVLWLRTSVMANQDTNKTHCFTDQHVSSTVDCTVRAFVVLVLVRFLDLFSGFVISFVFRPSSDDNRDSQANYFLFKDLKSFLQFALTGCCACPSTTTTTTTVASASSKAPTSNSILAFSSATSGVVSQQQQQGALLWTVAGSYVAGFHLKSALQPVCKLGHTLPLMGGGVGTGRALNPDEVVCLAVSHSTNNNDSDTFNNQVMATGWVDGAVRIFALSSSSSSERNESNKTAHSLLVEDDPSQLLWQSEPLLLNGHGGSNRGV
jgi:hypothetical protein